MKILQVSNFFKPSWETGGVTKVNYELSKQLVSRGHEVTVYTTDGYSSRLDVPKNQPVDVDGIKVYYFYNVFRLLVKKMKLPTPYYLPFVIRKEIKNFDIIHIHEHRTLSAAIVHYYAKKNGVPYVLQAHGSILPFLQKQNLKKVYDFLFGYTVLKNLTRAIALNEDEVCQYQKMGIDRKNIEIIPNGIDLDDYKNAPMQGTFKKMYKISENDKIILYIGRIHKNKGIDLLIQAFSLILEKFPNVKLIIVGPDNGFQHELENLTKSLHVEEHILFTGFIEKDEKMAVLVDANIFVTPSYSGFPISFLEACAFGLPVITTIKGDNLGWIHNNIGYVVQYDKDELCNAILSVFEDSKLETKFSIQSRKLIESHFSMNIYIGKIETLYKECVGTVECDLTDDVYI